MVFFVEHPHQVAVTIAQHIAYRGRQGRHLLIQAAVAVPTVVWIQYKKASDGGPYDPPTGGFYWESILLSPDGGPADGIYTATDNYMVLGFNLGGRAVTSNNTQPGYYNVDNVSVTPYPPVTEPVFTDITWAGADLILQGSNGPPSGVYQVLRSSDMTLPPTNRLDSGTDAFDINGSLCFTNTSPGDAPGFYLLRVVSLVSAPEITGQPQDLTVAVGDAAEFSVTAEGASPLYYQWYFNTNAAVTGETNAMLTLTDVQPRHAGTYSVTVSNVFGVADSDFARLTAITHPAIATPDGYATQNGGTTGGGNAEPVTVSTAAEFRSAVGNNDPAVIIVNGRLDVGSVDIGSNKTIIGADTNAGLYGGTIRVEGSNYIFQNLSMGPSSNGGDVMEISGAENVFVIWISSSSAQADRVVFLEESTLPKGRFTTSRSQSVEGISGPGCSIAWKYGAEQISAAPSCGYGSG